MIMHSMCIRQSQLYVNSMYNDIAYIGTLVIVKDFVIMVLFWSDTVPAFCYN